MQAALNEAAIRQRAYAIWEDEGRPHGRDWDHWLKASQEIRADIPETPAPVSAAEPRKPARRRIRAVLKAVMPA